MSLGTRWVTFDCYGTLIDWRAGFLSALVPLVGDRARDVVQAYHTHERRIERGRPYRAYADVIAMALVRAAADCGVTIPEWDGRTLVRAWASMRPFGDVEEMLAALRRKGYRLAVLTNSDWVHVASSWYHDIAPAHELGIRAIWLDRERTGEDRCLAAAHVGSAADVVGAASRLLEYAVPPPLPCAALSSS